jgi:hypothetical protein
MNSTLRVPLNTSPDQEERLRELQRAFADVCNALTPVVRERRLWNRVALHHLAYRALREQFPAMGSQMVCNAIYAVCRAARIVYQHPQSPFNMARFKDGKLPLLQFDEHCPVVFDRHTLSLKAGQLSMYTLDGRIRFQLQFSPADEARFHTERLRELLLSRLPAGGFELVFLFGEKDEEQDQDGAVSPLGAASGAVPNYVHVEEPI